MSRIKARPIIMDRVREIVWEADVSYREMARKLGVTSGYMISGWVNCDKTISVEVLARLCELYHINPAWVMGLSEKKYLKKSERKD